MLHVETERSFKATKSFLNHASVTMNYDSYVAVTSSFLMKSPIILSLPPQRKAENISTSSWKQSSLRMAITASRALVSYTFPQGSALPLRGCPCILMMETFPQTGPMQTTGMKLTSCLQSVSLNLAPSLALTQGCSWVWTNIPTGCGGENFAAKQ